MQFLVLKIKYAWTNDRYILNLYSCSYVLNDSHIYLSSCVVSFCGDKLTWFVFRMELINHIVSILKIFVIPIAIMYAIHWTWIEDLIAIGSKCRKCWCLYLQWCQFKSLFIQFVLLHYILLFKKDQSNECCSYIAHRPVPMFCVNFHWHSLCYVGFLCFKQWNPYKIPTDVT